MKIIDAHTHLLPGRIVGAKDERFGFEISPDGRQLVIMDKGYPYMPPLPNGRYEAADLIDDMDSHGIDGAIIMQSAFLPINQEVSQAVNAHPDRLRGAMIVYPDGGNCGEKIRELNARGLTVMKLEMSAAAGFNYPTMYPGVTLDSDFYRELFETANELGLAVAVDPSVIGGQGYQVEALDALTREYKNIHFVVCHLGYPSAAMKKGDSSYLRWEQMTELARRDNVWFDFAALNAVCQEHAGFDTARGLLREFTDRVGPEKAMWGTDLPGTLKDETIAELISIYMDSDIFTYSEKERFFGGNAAAAYGLSVGA